MPNAKRGLLGVGALLAALGLTVWLALEASGVAIVTTRRANGEPRTTHVWYVEEAGVIWLEAGTPENPWYLDVIRDPGLSFRSDEHPPRSLRARPVPERSATIRARLRAKYGLRDRLVGLFVDGSRSVAVRLDAEAGP